MTVTIDIDADLYEVQYREHVLPLMPKQYEFVTDTTHRELLYSGAFGAGKSRALCVRAVRMARLPGARVGLCRKTGADLKASTLITLLEPDGDLPPVLPPGSYDHHRADQRIKLLGGGEIVYFGIDNPTKVASRPLTDICLDEGIEADKDEYDMLLGRIRVSYALPDGSPNFNTLATATNPGAPSHFLYERFYPAGKHPSRLLIETNTAENYHLPRDYQESLNELSGPARDRYFLGMWVAYEGAIFWMFDPAKHIREEPDVWDYYVAGVDCGFQNPNVIRVHGCKNRSHRSHVLYEFYESHVLSPQFVEHCAHVASLWPRITFIIDPSAADVSAQLRERSIDVRKPPERDVLIGIRMVQAALEGDPTTGMPLLTMAPTCRKGNREYPTYRWKDGVVREVPIKQMDHALDADRYARTFIQRGLGEPVSLIPLHRRSEGRPLGEPPVKAPEPADGVMNPMDPRLWPRSGMR